MRITNKHLAAALNNLNSATNSPTSSYTKLPNGAILANVGNYHIDSAYGGNKLVRMASPGGSITTITTSYATKRYVLEFIHAMLIGIAAKQ